ncbi:PREDICTED: probable polygalacturonase [Nelumbo nucifera]|uniref:Probable polygalacturonase n=1 Tax=Nelumbo nucifera TaxID=4432 RepID=A0A1U8BJH4_NELNU|nr:PREDICTED: probable polygalacturonase [Nelumbo nucifera]
MKILSIFVLFGLLGLKVPECRSLKTLGSQLEYQAINCRKHSASLTDFGAVGDGTTVNTKAFQAAINHLSQFSSDGGAQLIVPPGKWLTGSFNLTSHFTLYLQKDATILGSVDESEYPIIDPLPSYGRGRDAPGGRYISLIFGTNLTDVVITGDNGTIDGQGEHWWGKFHQKKIKNTRPYLIEILYSDQVQISNLTLVNSPSWNVHPTYCSNVIIQGITILAPVNSPNTDGIDPDSCNNVRIEDCYIVSGDDCIAVKSGWDEYGIAFGMPTQHLIIRRLTCISPTSAVIALGSEMSGGIQDVRAEDIVAINSESGVRIKTAPGRGAYVKDIYVRRMNMNTMKYVFWMTGSYGQHPDEKYDPKALPDVHGINWMDMTAENVTIPAKLEGINGDPFTGICISNVTIGLSPKPKKVQWNCTDIQGVARDVTPPPCDLLSDQGSTGSKSCSFPTDRLPIDDVQLKICFVISSLVFANQPSTIWTFEADVLNYSKGIKKDGFGFTLVNFMRLCQTGKNLHDEPFVLTSQVEQVFYVKDPIDIDWNAVVIKTRELYDMHENGLEDDIEANLQSISCYDQSMDDDISWDRPCVDSTIVLLDNEENHQVDIELEEC